MKKPTKKPKAAWKDFYTGSIVKWSDDLWIVMEVDDDGLELICANQQNVTAHVTTTWPRDALVHTVEFVASCMKGYISMAINRSAFPELYK